MELQEGQADAEARELAAAATKIAAGFRGMKARREVEEMRAQTRPKVGLLPEGMLLVFDPKPIQYQPGRRETSKVRRIAGTTAARPPPMQAPPEEVYAQVAAKGPGAGRRPSGFTAAAPPPQRKQSEYFIRQLDSQPVYGNVAVTGYGATEPVYGQADPTCGKAEPVYGKAEPVYGKAEPMYEAVPEDYLGRRQQGTATGGRTPYFEAVNEPLYQNYPPQPETSSYREQGQQWEDTRL